MLRTTQLPHDTTSRLGRTRHLEGHVGHIHRHGGNFGMSICRCTHGKMRAICGVNLGVSLLRRCLTACTYLEHHGISSSNALHVMHRMKWWYRSNTFKTIQVLPKCLCVRVFSNHTNWVQAVYTCLYMSMCIQRGLRRHINQKHITWRRSSKESSP